MFFDKGIYCICKKFRAMSACAVRKGSHGRNFLPSEIFLHIHEPFFLHDSVGLNKDKNLLVDRYNDNLLIILNHIDALKFHYPRASFTY